MLLRRPMNPTVVLRLGLIALIVANVAHFMIQRSGRPASNTADALTGFLFGLAIGCLLLAIYLGRRKRPPTGN